MSKLEKATTRTPGQIIMTILANLLLVISGFLSGAVLGGLYVKLFLPRAAMGWDGIADALGGLMLGGVTGLVASIFLAGMLTVRRRLQVAAILLVVVLAVMSWGVITHEAWSEPEPVARE